MKSLIQTTQEVFTEETETFTEGTELYRENGISVTRFSMGKGKGMGIQITNGVKYVQFPIAEAPALAKILASKSIQKV